MDDPVVVYVTASSEEEAGRIGKTLVQEGFAACVNIVSGIRSIYVWKGELCDDDEVLLIIKSRRIHIDEIVKRVKDLHSYQVPEVIALPIIQGSEDYLNWMEESLS